eukprot:7389109-Prymnesium_polylepis.2
MGMNAAYVARAGAANVCHLECEAHIEGIHTLGRDNLARNPQVAERAEREPHNLRSAHRLLRERSRLLLEVGPHQIEWTVDRRALG